MLVTRTDPEAPKHKGMTYFALDMHAPGVEVRPLRQITGEAEFNEVYMTDVRIPDAHRVGEVGEGWRASLTTLMNERNAIGTGGGAGSGSVARRGGAANDAVALWNKMDPSEQPGALKDTLMRWWIQAEVNRLTNRRAGENAKAGNPGPEMSIAKLAFSELNKGLYSFCIDLMGADGDDRVRLHVPPPGRGRPRRRRIARHRLLVPARAGELDRGWNVGDPAQHHRRTGPRPARRTPRRQVGARGTRSRATSRSLTSGV